MLQNHQDTNPCSDTKQVMPTPKELTSAAASFGAWRRCAHLALDRVLAAAGAGMVIIWALRGGPGAEGSPTTAL